MDHLLENWENIESLFMDPIFLMTDFDGTLVSIEDRPEDAELSDEVKDLLIQLLPHCPIGIVSGRALSDLKSRIGIEGIYYSGNHGFQISGPGIDFVKEEAEQAREIIEIICNKAEKELVGSIDGLIVENKGYTASFHYRLVGADDIPKLKNFLQKEAEPYREKDIIEINRGKKIWEITPAIEWDKGQAVSLLLRFAGCEEERLPLYLGDDVTDEHAFSALRWNGIGILVSEEDRETAAHFRLKDHEEVSIFLERLLEILK